MATTLGGAAAVALVALFTRLSWGLRIGLVALVIVGAVGYLLWRRRARIVEEIAAETAQRQSPPNGPA